MQEWGYNIEGTGLRGERFIKIILLMAIAYLAAIAQGTEIQKKQVQKYVSRGKDSRKKYRRRSTFGIGHDGEQWVNYFDRHLKDIQELMKLTRNKHRLCFLSVLINAWNSVSIYFLPLLIS